MFSIAEHVTPLRAWENMQEAIFNRETGYSRCVRHHRDGVNCKPAVDGHQFDET